MPSDDLTSPFGLLVIRRFGHLWRVYRGVDETLEGVLANGLHFDQCRSGGAQLRAHAQAGTRLQSTACRGQPGRKIQHGLGLLQLRDHLRGSIEVDLHSDEVLIDVIRGVDVGGRVAVHEVTTRTPHCPHIEKDRNVRVFCSPESIFTPRVPVHGLIHSPR